MLNLLLIPIGIIFAILTYTTGEDLFIIGVVIPSLLNVIGVAWFPELLSLSSIWNRVEANTGNIGKVVSYNGKIFEIKEIYEARGIKKYRCRGLSSQKPLRVNIDDEGIKFLYNNKFEYRQQLQIQNSEDNENPNKLI